MVRVKPCYKELSDQLCMNPFLKYLERNGVSLTDRRQNLWIEPISDMSVQTTGRGLAIDAALLKHCNYGASNTASKLEKAGIDPLRPYVLLAYPNINSAELIEKELFPYADLVIYGEATTSNSINQGKRRLRALSGMGELPFLHAGAAATIWGDNFAGYHHTLHNIVEGTSGGPLFLIPPYRTGQYGYKEYAEKGLVRVSLNPEDLLEQVKKYMWDADKNKANEHRETRRGIITRNRRKFYPMLLELVRLKAQGRVCDFTVPEDFDLSSANGTTYFIHKDSTDWRLPVWHPRMKKSRFAA